MDPEDPALRPLRIATTLTIWLATAVLPCGVLALATGGWMVATVSMSGGATHMAPWVDGVAVWSSVALRIAAPLSLGPALVLGVRRIPGMGWKIGVGAVLAVLHLFLVAATWVPTAGVVLQTLNGEQLAGRAAEPHGARRAVLYRHETDCTWTTWISEPLEPVATRHSQVSCDCAAMPEATLVWTGPDPALVGPDGLPYACPSPPTCATGPVPAGLLALCLVAGLSRRRRRDGPRPGSTTARRAPLDRRSPSA